LFAAISLLAIAQDWAVLRISATGLPTVTESISGQQLAPLAAAVMLVVLAASLALLALRRWAVYLVVTVFLADSLTSIYGGVSYLTSPLARALGAANLGLAPDSGVTLEATGSAWPFVLIGSAVGLIGVSLSLIAQMRKRDSLALATKYERSMPHVDPQGDAAIWDAQDDGLDITGERPQSA
jgi:uncharacterized membrane protein (TIGR02234 family)